MKARQWSLAIVLILINYLIFATLFTRLLETDFTDSQATRTPIPTFTPAPAEPFVIVPTPEPITPEPTPTATRVLGSAPAGDGQPAASESDQVPAAPQEQAQPAPQPQLVAPGSVNIRSGPGLNYTVIGTLNANTTMTIIGRNAESSWWQIELPNDGRGWVAGSVVNATNVQAVPQVNASP